VAPRSAGSEKPARLAARSRPYRNIGTVLLLLLLLFGALEALVNGTFVVRAHVAGPCDRRRRCRSPNYEKRRPIRRCRRLAERSVITTRSARIPVRSDQVGRIRVDQPLPRRTGRAILRNFTPSVFRAIHRRRPNFGKRSIKRTVQIYAPARTRIYVTDGSRVHRYRRNFHGTATRFHHPPK